MKINSVGIEVNIPSRKINFRNQTTIPAKQQGHDVVVIQEKQNRNRIYRFIGGVAAVGVGLLLLRLTNKKPSIDSTKLQEFKNIEQAKEYFEKLDIKIDFRGVKDEHLPLLTKISENLKQLKEMGVKKEKPDSITISDWNNKTELEELYRNNNVVLSEYKPDFFAQCVTSKDKKKNIYINSNKPDFDKFRHEMGHANDGCYDSFWHSKGFLGHDFIDNQLKILGKEEKIYRQAGDFNNIFYFQPSKTSSSFTFPNENMETRYVHAQKMISEMQKETNCYAPDLLHEQKADIFEGLLKGQTYSDEVMLYYDFSGGARIPNLKIDGKSYDEYIESLYKNQELIQKLKENIKISKL